MTEGVCNGSRGIIKHISTRILEVQLFSGTTVLVPRIKLISADPDILFKLCHLQFPVSLSFVMTINKSRARHLRLLVWTFSILCSPMANYMLHCPELAMSPHSNVSQVNQLERTE
jgi:hypothetical protein